MSGVRVALVIMVAVITLAAAIAGGNGSAQELRARWQLFERAAPATPFQAGVTPIDPPGSGAGYEIVSFAALPLATGLSTYVYGGADLPPALGGPASAIVTCAAQFTAATMELQVAGAYPYAGCVFFLGVQDIGEGTIRVELGPLADASAVSCNAPGCQAGDIEILAGGSTAEEIAANCRLSEGVTNPEGLVFELTPGASVVCPLFVVVLQPAAEGATYTVVITPPPPTGGSGPTSVLEPAGPDPALIATPIAPATGSGLVLEAATGVRAWVALAALAGLVLILLVAWPRRA